MYAFFFSELVHCSVSNSNCCCLTCIQVFQETDKVVWYSNMSLRISHSLLWSTQSKASDIILNSFNSTVTLWDRYFFYPSLTDNRLRGVKELFMHGSDAKRFWTQACSMGSLPQGSFKQLSGSNRMRHDHSAGSGATGLTQLSRSL